MEAFTRNVAGTGGLVTFKDSNWLMSVVLYHEPHFVGQQKDDVVFTVEYSVRAAQMAVYQLLAIERSLPPVTRHDKSVGSDRFRRKGVCLMLRRDNRPSEGCALGRFRVSGLCFARNTARDWCPATC
ncbi:hypothetical protein ES707_10790 [subsurface metagenome]